jgi:hypothetical protein
MAFDSARYFVLLGLNTDLYFQSGLVMFPRILVSVPAIPGTGTQLGFWWEISLGLGWAF